ncbi:MAG: aspartate/glutamate racemase family protein [Cupriavidus necator]
MVRSEQRGFLGILMLDTKFPRPLGDIGNSETFHRLGIPVRFLTVRGASPKRIVQEADPALLQPFVDAGRELASQGARMISTSCGFLASYQDHLSKAVPVPVITSSLLQCARLSRPGIVTIDAASLDDRILAAAGVPPGTPVQGVEPGCEFHRRILGDETQLDTAKAEQDVIAAARLLIERHPSVAEIVLECTNMPPYRQAVMDATGREVHDIVSLLTTAWAGLPKAA